MSDYTKTKRREEIFQKKSTRPIKYTEVEEYEIIRPIAAKKLADDLHVSSFDLLRFMPQAYLTDDLIPVREVARLALRIGVKKLKVFDPVASKWIDPPRRRGEPVEDSTERANEPIPGEHLLKALSEDKPSKPPKKFVSTAPVVTIMGHVDVGKTTILDKIRATNVVSQEHGAITQHIGAFEYTETKNKTYKGRKITFIDTPGHAAFAKMRSTGARVTDVIVLVVAADDGVMPQTIESIKVAQKEQVPLIVALNKMDKENAYSRNQLEMQLMEAGIIPDTKGGDTPIIPISALKEQGIEDVMEAIYLQADLLELKAPTDTKLEAVVIECKMHRALGMATTVIVKQGILKPGMWLVAGTTYGKVKSVKDFQLKSTKQALPGSAVEITGLESMPEVGSILKEIPNPKVVKDVIEVERERTLATFDEKEARKIFQQRKKESEEGVTRLDLLDEMSKDDSLHYSKADTDINLYEEETDQLGNVKKYMPVIFRADAEGSIDAFHHIIADFPSALVQMRVVEQSVGDISERDVDYARATGSEVICMNVSPPKRVLSYAENAGVKVSIFRVIYHLIEHLKNLIVLNMEPRRYLEDRGVIEVLQPFSYQETIKGEKVELPVAGGRCALGEFIVKNDDPNIFYHVKRGGKLILENAKIFSLKVFKNTVSSVKKGQECGCAILGYEPKVGDQIICQEKKVQVMTWEDLVKQDAKAQKKSGGGARREQV